MTDITSRDDFAGPGGWDEGLRLLGVTGGVGVEIDADACATARAAGHVRLQADVRTLDPVDWRGLPLYIGSPPCPTFSTAGKGAGRIAMPLLVAAAELLAQTPGMTPAQALAAVDGGHVDDMSALALEPLRVIRDAWPTAIALEQVRNVQPLWDVYAAILPRWGYSVATGVLSTEQYGVPQKRLRAALVAHAHRRVALPTPTHSRYDTRHPERVEMGVKPWVSMADALGWLDDDRVGFPRRADSADTVTIDGVDYRARDLRAADQPAQTVIEKVRSWSRFSGAGPGAQERVRQRPRNGDEPAHTITGARSAYWLPPADEQLERVAGLVAERVNDQSGTEYDPTWPARRPSRAAVSCRIRARRRTGSTAARSRVTTACVSPCKRPRCCSRSAPTTRGRGRSRRSISRSATPSRRCSPRRSCRWCCDVSHIRANRRMCTLPPTREDPPMVANTDPTAVLIDLIAEAIRPYVRSAAPQIDDATAVHLAATDAVRALDRLAAGPDDALALSASVVDGISEPHGRHFHSDHDIAAQLARESAFYSGRGGWSLRLEQ